MPEEICGVDADIIEELIEVVVEEDKYSSKAELFLKEAYGTSFLTPRRVIVGYLIDVVQHKNTYSREQLKGVVESAKKDVGKRILDDYRFAIITSYSDVINIIEKSRTAKKYRFSLKTPLDRILALLERGGRGVGKPCRTGEWEESMKALTIGLKELTDLRDKVTEFQRRDVERRRHGWQLSLGLCGLLAGIIGILLTIFL